MKTTATTEPCHEDPRLPLLRHVAGMVRARERVLDIGCGEGVLLDLMHRERGAIVRGLELSPQGVRACVARGHSVVQGDADQDLADYPDKAFDVVILTRTIQAMRDPRTVLAEVLRIGERAVVSIPNFGHWRLRLALLFSGRMPRSTALPANWYDTENIHLCTIADFMALCQAMDITIVRCFAGRANRVPKPVPLVGPGKRVAQIFANLRAEEAIFELRGSAG